MNVLLLLSHIKGFIFVLKSLIEYNINFIYCKLTSCSKIKIHALIVSELFQTYYFCSKESNFFTVKEIPLIKDYSTVKEIFFDQGNFLQNI